VGGRTSEPCNRGPGPWPRDRDTPPIAGQIAALCGRRCWRVAGVDPVCGSEPAPRAPRGPCARESSRTGKHELCCAEAGTASNPQRLACSQPSRRPAWKPLQDLRQMLTLGIPAGLEAAEFPEESRWRALPHRCRSTSRSGSATGFQQKDAAISTAALADQQPRRDRRLEAASALSQP